MTQGRLLIFDTHPIAYRSPVFRALHESHGNMKVYFLSSGFDGGRWWFHETGKTAPQTQNPKLTEGFPNETLGTEKLGVGGTLKALHLILKNERPAAVLIYGYYLPDHWTLRWLTARMGIPLLFVGETFAATNGRARKLLRAPLRKYFFRGVSRFVAIGDRTAALYDSLGVPAERVDRAKYCADVSFFERSEAEARERRAKWRRSWSLGEEAFVLLFVGRLFERKRPLDAVALHKLLLTMKSVHTFIVGSGNLETAVRKAADGVSRLEVLGFKNRDELLDLYHGADLLIVPSEFETWGLVVNEAFAAGTPALVTSQCGVAGDLVIPGKTGFIFPVGALAEAARLVRAALKDRKRFEKVAAAARQKAGTEYRADQFAEVLKQSSQRAAESGGGQLQS